MLKKLRIKTTVFTILAALFLTLSIPESVSIAREYVIGAKVKADYEFTFIYHPSDYMTSPFLNLNALIDGQMVPIPSLARTLYLDGQYLERASQYYKADFTTEHRFHYEIAYYNTVIELHDSFITHAEQWSALDIIIGGESLSAPEPIRIRPQHLDNNRYHGYLNLLLMKDKETNEEQLVIVQRLFDNMAKEEDFRWNIIMVGQDQIITFDTFSRAELKEKPYLVNMAPVPYALGYYSNTIYGYPSLFYPILFPTGLLLLGLLCVVLSIINLVKYISKSRL